MHEEESRSLESHHQLQLLHSHIPQRPWHVDHVDEDLGEPIILTELRPFQVQTQSIVCVKLTHHFEGGAEGLADASLQQELSELPRLDLAVLSSDHDGEEKKLFKLGIAAVELGDFGGVDHAFEYSVDFEKSTLLPAQEPCLDGLRGTEVPLHHGEDCATGEGAVGHNSIGGRTSPFPAQTNLGVRASHGGVFGLEVGALHGVILSTQSLESIS